MILKDISSLTDAKKQFIIRLTEDLNKIENVQAIALGGSHATGRANTSSDIDIGVYYYEKEPFSIEMIKEIARKYAVNDDPVVVGFYEWGPWVNGGAWIYTEIGKVDILYRNINQIENTIADAQLGKWENHYEQQPPYGFTTMIYLAECVSYVPLIDPKQILHRLKQASTTYPQALKVSVINTALWSAEFTLAHAHGFAMQKDMYNLLGCFTRALKSILEALFALNSIYPISDKHAVQLLSNAAIVPMNLEEKVNAILEIDSTAVGKNVVSIQNLFAEVVTLTNGLYHSKFNFKEKIESSYRMHPPNFSNFPVLETSRLILRRLSLNDAEEIYQLRTDVDVAALTGRTPCVNIEEAIAYINKIDGMINKNECIFWAVSQRENPALIGVACLWNFDIKKGTVEIGYELLEKFQGKGIMGEVIVRILQYAFDVMGAETIIAFPSGENPPSVRLLQKLGFELAPGHFKNTHINVPNMLTYILSRST